MQKLIALSVALLCGLLMGCQSPASRAVIADEGSPRVLVSGGPAQNAYGKWVGVWRGDWDTTKVSFVVTGVSDDGVADVEYSSSGGLTHWVPVPPYRARVQIENGSVILNVPFPRAAPGIFTRVTFTMSPSGTLSGLYQSRGTLRTVLKKDAPAQVSLR